MKKGIDWVLNDPDKEVNLDLLIGSALINEADYDPLIHGEGLIKVSSVSELMELFPDHLEPNMAILRSDAHIND